MFLLNSRRFLFIETIQYPLSRSYRAILPSSFNIITLFAIIYSTILLVLELVRFLVKIFPDFIKKNYFTIQIIFF